jgi:hypothetical protein
MLASWSSYLMLKYRAPTSLVGHEARWSDRSSTRPAYSVGMGTQTSRLPATIDAAQPKNLANERLHDRYLHHRHRRWVGLWQGVDERLHNSYLHQCLLADVVGLGDRILPYGEELGHGVAVRPLMTTVTGTTACVKTTSCHTKLMTKVII